MMPVTEERCQGCDGREFRVARRVQGSMPSDVLQCRACGLLWRQGPMIELYGAARLGTRPLNVFQETEQRVSQARARIWNDVFPRLLPYSQNGRLLDIGCSRGHFVAAARQAGWNAEGVEPSAGDCHFAQDHLGLSIRNEAFGPGLYPQGSFDAITCWNVLDHMTQPLEALTEMHALLRPGGVLALRVPNGKLHLLLHRAARDWGIKDYSIFHNYAFDARSIKTLLARAGFVRCNIFNGVPSIGDPYGLFGKAGAAAVDAVKMGIFSFSQLLYFASGGKWLSAPSYLILAFKNG